MAEMADDPCVLVKRCNSDWSCCGIVLDSDNGILLTVASLFSDILYQNEKQRTISTDSPVLFKDDFEESSPNHEIAVEVTFRRHTEEEFTTLKGCVILFWRDYGLQRIAERIFPPSEWKFESFGQSDLKGTSNEGTGNETFLHRNALSDFVLIQVKTLKNYFSCNSVKLSMLLGYQAPKKGDTLYVVGTPFGCECPPVFYNSLSKGIASNVVGSNGEIIITDARCVPGCEGCALYTNSQKPGLLNSRDLYGIVLAPFCWRNGEWIGITVASSLWYILHNLLKLVSGNILIPQNLHGILVGVLDIQVKIQIPLDAVTEDNMYPDKHSTAVHFNQDSSSAQDIIKTTHSSLVMVQCGNRWGSGIVVDGADGLIATCSHVIRDCQNPVIVTQCRNIAKYFNSIEEVNLSENCQNSVHQKAQVLFATREECPLDFALLKMQPSHHLRSLSTKPLYKKGEDVFIVGFPLFASHLNTGASVVSGVISNIAYAQNQAVLLQSSATVHCGMSGGAVVSMETGELLGMVTSQTKDENMSSAFPHVNFSIPADLLYKLISAVRNQTVEDTLHTLVSDYIKNIWQLKNIANEKPQITSKL